MRPQKWVGLGYLALGIVLALMALAVFGDKLVWVCLPYTDEQ